MYPPTFSLHCIIQVLHDGNKTGYRYFLILSHRQTHRQTLYSMKQHLFLVSTPFNMLTASMVAFSLPAADTKTLWLIDQPTVQSDFVTALLEWPASPFKNSRLVSHKSSGKGKRAQRKESLKSIDALLADIKPDKIYTGNDRRVEFQYSMAHAAHSPIGVYLDDGTYTYLGRKTHWFTDRLLDNLIKKLIYGYWWKQPETIGASDWIQEAYIAFPQFACAPLLGKTIHPLPLNLITKEFRQLSNICLKSNLESHKVDAIEGLVLLPHDSVLKPSTLLRIKEWCNSVSGLIAFKHHPRTTNKTLFSIAIPEESYELPSEIPMEVMLPLLSKKTHVIGDISTALLTTKWLRPELEVTALTESVTDPDWIKLLSALKIKTEL